MASKNIKIVDEHGIDRVGNIVCKFDVNGSDYVFYTIERDSQSDNIFVSKLIKNVDGTCNMINIDDDNEKSKASDIIKRLVKYSIDNEENKLSSNSVKLGDSEYAISDVIINKEQYINVPKTYITTVDKKVTKVCVDYYGVDTSKVEENNIFVDFPTIEALPNDKVQEVTKEENVPEVIAPVIEVPETVVALPKEEAKVDIPTIELPKIEEPVIEEPTVVTPTPEVIPSTPIVESSPVVGNNIPNLLEPVINTTENVIESAPVVDATENVAVSNLEESKPSVEAAAVVESTPIVFDASKENNLNVALGEVSAETSIPVAEIDSVREFGEETPTVTEDSPVLEEPKVRTLSKGGFASNKFVMIIAILFFVASCVFLGYEVFNYFQIK